MAKRILNAALVGAGAIGSLWDEQIPLEQRKRKPITHASAIESLRDCRLLALCDVNGERLRAAAGARSPAHSFPDIGAMLASLGDQIDLLVLATGPGRRAQAFSAIAGCARPPLIMCEKPVAADFNEARSLMRISRDAQLSVQVPFLRRWIPACREAKRLVASGAIGPIRKVTATYGKGITNNGSHLFDLLIWLFGVPVNVRANEVANDDRSSGSDPTIGGEVGFSNHGGDAFLAHLLPTDHRAWTTFECDILGQHGRIKLTDRCTTLELYRAVPDPEYPGYVVLQREPAAIPEEVAGPFAAMYQECERRLSAQRDDERHAGEDGATLRDALLAQAACAATIQSYKQGFKKLSFAPFVKEWIDE